MTAGELIEALSLYDKDWEVWMDPDDSTSLGIKRLWHSNNVIHLEKE